MTNESTITDEKLEELKRKHGIDERIAKQSGKPIGVIEEELDPSLRNLIRRFKNLSNINRKPEFKSLP